MLLRHPYLALFLIAFLVRLLIAWPQQQPNYMDAAYSYVNALNLIAGRGFVEDFVWNYLGQPGPPPQPSHLYWMPLTSILAWLGMLVGGASYRAAQLPFIILSAVLAPLSYWTGSTLTGQRWLGWLSGLLAIFSGFYVPFWTAIDNFTPFAVAGSLALLAAWQGSEDRISRIEDNKSQTTIHHSKFTIQNYQWLFLSGLCVGLAHLARADGPLLLAAMALVMLYRSNFNQSGLTHYVLRLMLPVGLGYLLIMTPWFIRNWQVVGTALPAAGSQTIWLADYDELFSYGRELSAITFWAQGLASILAGRWWALTTNLQTVLAVWGMIFLTPLAVLGGWHLRRHLLVQLAGGYALLLFVVMTVIFAFPGARGGLFHSGAALLPFIYATALVGLDRAVVWMAARRRRWDARLARRFLGAGLVVIAISLSAFIYYGRVLKNDAWNRADSLYPAIAAWVAQQNSAAIVMIGNPPAYRYHGGGLSVVVPNQDITTTLQAAAQYDVTYLVLDHHHPAPLTGLYTNPHHYPDLALAQTFTDDAGSQIYIFKIIRPNP